MPSKGKRPLLHSRAKECQPSNLFDEQWNKIHRTTQRKKLQRKNTHSSNQILDKRIGERNPNLDEQSRYLFRLQRERAKRVKKHVLFTLNDEDQSDDEVERSPFLERTDGPVPSEAEEGSELSGSVEDAEKPFFSIKEAEDGPAEQQQEAESDLRSKKEVMQEVIEKSKMFKTLRQHIKHKTDEETLKLDEKLPQIMQLLAKSNAETPSKISKLNLKSTVKNVSIFGDEERLMNRNKSFSYEDVYRQLALEKRAAPSERLLTEEESAQRQKEQLMRLEKLRNSRMRNIADDDDVRSKSKTSGDDNNDDFEDILSHTEESSDESEYESHIENGDGMNGDQRITDLSVESFLAVESGGLKNIPFVYKKMPFSEADLQRLFEGTTVQQRSIIMDRLGKCFASSLNPGKNRPKLVRLSELALQRVLSLCRITKRFSTVVAEVDMLIGQVHKLGFEQVANAWGRRQILQSYTRLREGQGGLSERWGVFDVMVLRAVGALFPASDARHVVSTPLQILLSEALSMEYMKSIGDVGLGVFVGNVLLELLVEAERFSPLLAAFSVEILRACGRNGRLCSVLNYTHDPLSGSLTLSEVASIMMGSAYDEKTITVKIVNAAICFAEELTFSGRLPHADLVFSQIPLKQLPHDLATRMEALFTRCRKGRLPLQLYTKNNDKQSFKLRNPRFSSENGVYRKRPKSTFDSELNGDVSASAKRIRRALKKEERGLARDVRREAELHAADEAATERINREDRDARDKTVRAFFETQQATWRAAEKRQKKLSGKKW